MPGPGEHPTVGSWGLDPGVSYSVGGRPPTGGGQPTGFPFGGNGGGWGGAPQGWGGPPPGQGQQAFDASGRPIQPTGPHPTVPYGEQPPQGGSWGAPPGWSPGYGQQPGWGQPPQGGGQQPQGGQPQGGRAFQLQDDMLLDGPNVPPELRGRTFGQVKAIYTALANDWLTRQRSATPPQGGGQPGAGGGQPGMGAPPQGQQPPGAPRWDWSNPADAFRSVVREELGTMLQPLMAQSNATGVAQARSVAQQQIPDFGYLEGTIMQHVANLPPESLADPRVWINAARLARGELMETGQYRFGAGAGGGGGQQPTGQPTGWQGGPGAPPGFGAPRQGLSSFVNGQGNAIGQPPAGFGYGTTGIMSVPANQPYQFFSEGPTPPAFSELGGGGLSPAEAFVAREMGMAADQYLVWRGGVQR